MNKKILVYLALMFLGVYMMPVTVALFAGQHTYYEGLGVSCDRCHSDVSSQLEAGASYEKHRLAAGNYNYTTYLSLGGKSYDGSVITDYNNNVWTWNGNAWQNGANTRNVSLDKNNNGVIEGDEICMLCHNASLSGSTAHTGIIVRVCDDDRCHGNRNRNNSYNSPQLFNKNTSNITAAGYYLGMGNVHSLYYLDAGNQSSSYRISSTFGTPGNVNGSSDFISKGFWTCEGCHTGTVVNVTVIPAEAFNHSDSNAAKQRY